MRVAFGLSLSCLLLGTDVMVAQDYTSYGNSNYGGVLQVISNPALIAGTKLKLDVLVGGFDVTFNNSWASVKKEAISFPALPPSWKNYTPNLPGNIYKNFVFHHEVRRREVMFGQRFLLPSVMYRLDRASAVAFSCGMRQIGNMSGISAALAGLFEKEFDLGVLQNNHVQNKDFRAIRMTWIEYGFTYARAFDLRRRHALKLGVTPKLVQGLEAAYFQLSNLDFLFSNKDTLSFLEAEFSVAHTARSGNILNVTKKAGDKLSHAVPVKPGLDVGFAYEWKPAPAREGEPQRGPLMFAANGPYLVRLAASVVDIGRITFKKEPNYYEMKMSIRQADIIRYIASENVQMIDSLLRTDYPANTGADKFTVIMPTAVNGHIDFCYNRHLFLNAGVHLAEFYEDEFFRVRNYSAFVVAPRFESYWVDMSLPFTWNALAAVRGKGVTPGINLRFGPLSVGSTDLSYLFSNEVASVNLYFLLRVSIPHKEKYLGQYRKAK